MHSDYDLIPIITLNMIPQNKKPTSFHTVV